MDISLAIQLLLTLAALTEYSAEGKTVTVCRKSLRKLYKRQVYLDGSAVFPQDEARDLGCVTYELNNTITTPPPRPRPTLPARWVYHPHPVVVYLPRNNTQVWPQGLAPPMPGNFNMSEIMKSTQQQPQPQPVVVHGQTLRPVFSFPPELEAFLRDYRAGQGVAGPRGAQLVMAKPVNMIQLPSRGLSDLFNSTGRMPDFQKGGEVIKGADAAFPGPAPHTPPRPSRLFGHVYTPKLPYRAYYKPSP
ncbi:hypothetical protein AMEX_G10155 [Astyanax mexicanus]|uniref:Uncharacterized protein n=1 Tax=Astyanax mexicanus TaxID=7994 RepID=A0A8T2LW21_ASTMX|nr:hypothetical protein AMEX_G10155 [Astyanax mexicanus]